MDIAEADEAAGCPKALVEAAVVGAVAAPKALVEAGAGGAAAIPKPLAATVVVRTDALPKPLLATGVVGKAAVPKVGFAGAAGGSAPPPVIASAGGVAGFGRPVDIATEGMAAGWPKAAAKSRPVGGETKGAAAAAATPKEPKLDGRDGVIKAVASTPSPLGAEMTIAAVASTFCCFVCDAETAPDDEAAAAVGFPKVPKEPKVAAPNDPLPPAPPKVEVGGGAAPNGSLLLLAGGTAGVVLLEGLENAELAGVEPPTAVAAAGLRESSAAMWIAAVMPAMLPACGAAVVLRSTECSALLMALPRSVAPPAPNRPPVKCFVTRPAGVMSVPTPSANSR